MPSCDGHQFDVPVCEPNSARSPAFRARYRPPVSVRKIPFPGPPRSRGRSRGFAFAKLSAEEGFAASGAERGDGGPSVGFAGAVVTVGAAATREGGADVWLVRYDPHVIEVAVRRGENAGKMLPHKNVVREMILLGHWRGEAAKFPIPAGGDSELAEAAIVQSAGAGPVLAAARR